MGFSNGCAELTLKKPPPLLPSCLIAIQPATGPPGMSCFTPSTVVTAWKPWKFAITPWLPRRTANTIAIGNRMRVVPRTMSTQKLPMNGVRLRVIPRISATTTASPTAAEAKCCTIRPPIDVRWLIVFSPP